MDYAFVFFINNGGIGTEVDYPYIAYDGRWDQYRKNTRLFQLIVIKMFLKMMRNHCKRQWQSNQ